MSFWILCCSSLYGPWPAYTAALRRYISPPGSYFGPERNSVGAMTEHFHGMDVWALGCTVYYLLVGLHPHRGLVDMQIMNLIREGTLPRCVAREGRDTSWLGVIGHAACFLLCVSGCNAVVCVSTAPPPLTRALCFAAHGCQSNRSRRTASRATSTRLRPFSTAALPPLSGGQSARSCCATRGSCRSCSVPAAACDLKTETKARP